MQIRINTDESVLVGGTVIQILGNVKFEVWYNYTCISNTLKFRHPVSCTVYMQLKEHTKN